MAGSDWNFLAGRLLGDGTVEITETELPIDIQSIDSTLSTPSMMRGTISREVQRLKSNDGRPVFEPWNTVILAEASDDLRAYGIYRPSNFQGPSWEIDVIGLPGYAIGMPYDGDVSFIREDPLNIYRHVWDHLQSWPMGNLGLTYDMTLSPVRVGRSDTAVTTEQAQISAANAILSRLENNETITDNWTWTDAPTEVTTWSGMLLAQYKGEGGSVADKTRAKAWLTTWIAMHQTSTSAGFDDGPRRLNWWSTPDLGAVIDDLSRTTPFDWRERVYWEASQPRCHIELGYPTIGGIDERHRFVLGENLMTEPRVTESEFVNTAMVLGNGEGRARVRGMAGVSDGRIRRVVSVQDESLFYPSDANRRAQDEINSRRGQLVVDQIEVIEHPNAPIASITPGNEYAFFAETDHVMIDSFIRVLGKSESPSAPGRATLTVMRGGVA